MPDQIQRCELVELALQIGDGAGGVTGGLGLLAQPARRQLNRQASIAGTHDDGQPSNADGEPGEHALGVEQDH